MDYSYDVSHGASSEALAMLLTGPVIIFFLILVALIVVAYWKIFTKAGEEGWKALIPLYNTYVLCKISCNNPVLIFVLMLLPGVNVFATVYLFYQLSKSFGRGIGTAIGLFLLTNIFMLILAFGSAEYIGPEGAPVTQAS